MRRIPPLTSIAIATTLALAGCASPDDRSAADPTAKPASSEPTSDEITFGERLAQIRGHHLVAAELYAAKDVRGAATHTGHPVEELLETVRSEVDEHDEAVADRLEPALQDVSQVVADGGSTDELSAAMTKAAGVVSDAESAVVGEKRTSTAYRASVIAALLRTAGHEYEEALQDGKVALLAEYQDAYGFTAFAKRQYAAISGEVRKAGAHQADEIDEDFEMLGDALRSPAPPADPADAEAVERAANHVGTELAETVDAVLLDQTSSEDAFAKIDSLLDDIVAKVEAGDRDDAAELAAEAYLENYELIEADVIEHAPDVNEELEPLLGSQLRAKIRDGAPVAEIRQLVSDARRLLKDAQAALETATEHG